PRLIGEARRLLAAGGFFAVSWADPARPSLESPPSEGGAIPGSPSPLGAIEAQRRLAETFAYAVVVARHPYLGFQYASGIDTQGALTLDSSLTGGAESPTGWIAIAGDAPLPLSGDALIQVPYDKAVA